MKKIYLSLLATLIILSSCRPGDYDSMSQSAATPTSEQESDVLHESAAIPESEALQESNSLQEDMPQGANSQKAAGGTNSPSARWNDKAAQDSSKRFIRTADIKFEVQNLTTDCYSIEDIVRRAGGYISNSELLNSVSSKKTTPISADSTLETTFYNLTCSMTLRVPSYKLDTIISQILGYSKFINYRKIRSTDVALELLVLRLKANRARRYENMTLTQGQKNAVQNAMEMAITADEALVDRMRMNDQIQYSTIFLEIYQRETAQREVVANYTSTQTYEPSFGTKAVQSLRDGFVVIQVFVLLLLKIWWLLLLAAIVAIIIVRYKRKMKAKNSEK